MWEKVLQSYMYVKVAHCVQLFATPMDYIGHAYLLLSQPSATTNLFAVLIVLPFLKLEVNEVIC